MSRAEPELVVPAPHAVHDLTCADGAIIRLRRHGRPGGPRLVLSHGNGLAIDAYLPFWARLAERYELILFDLRNHGRNPPHGPSGHDWDGFLEDLETVWHGIRCALGDAPAAGLFHSASAITALRQQAERGRRWDLVIAFDRR